MSEPQGQSHRIEPTLNARPSYDRIKFDNVREKPSIAPPSPPVHYLPWLLVLLVLLLVVALYQESRGHFYQSTLWHWYAAKLTYQVKPGPSTQIRFPSAGPFDQRFGYSGIPVWSSKLQNSGFAITEQSQFSEDLLRYVNNGFSPPYTEKNHAGLSIQSCQQQLMYQSKAPAFQFDSLQNIAPLLVQSLLFVEDRTLLTPTHPHANPVINFPRLGAALWSQLQRAVGIPANAAGGSTLATQLEKYRHSPQGLTSDIAEKTRQLVSASVRAYQHGVDTRQSRQKIVLDYINTVPLAATATYGEVNGIGEGLFAWFGAEPSRVNQLLKMAEPYSEEQALALKQVLALIIAQRRPSYYLLQGRNNLEQLVNSHLNLMRQQALLPDALASKAIKQPLHFNGKPAPMTARGDDFKAVTMVRTRLSQLLNQNLYQLDRLDLSSQTTLHSQLQRDVSKQLRQLNDFDTAEQAGLFAERLLQPGQQHQVKYSFTLYQATDSGNKVRVQTDTTDQPFDLNDASKLELGSTAKLRVLISYLEIIAELHRLYSEEPTDTLQFINIAPQDNLTAWSVAFLIDNPGVRLDTMLQQALERRYSADPQESFLTGGGLHAFNNFRKEENVMKPTVAEALQQSINLPFVRLLQDIVNYSIYHGENSSYQLLADDTNPQRDQYLRRFADREGTTFIRRFWQKYHQKTTEQRLQLYIASSRQTPERLAVAFLTMQPEATAEQFISMMQQQFGNSTGNADLLQLYAKYRHSTFNLPDRAYLSRSHPLELWLLSYLHATPEATLKMAIADSSDTRQEVYQWLFKTRFRSARDNRIRNMLEIEAFWDLHHRWQRLGYPFDYLVPSLATALGSSGDRPAALAELMGIILNNGKRLPTVRIDALSFANNTPYYTQFRRQPSQDQQVIEPEVALAVRRALQQVVSDGTGRRLNNSYATDTTMIGGKTGTGDNRLVQLNTKGQQVSSKAVNRTATFVFYLGDKHFGVLTAYVPEAKAAQFSFTSALPLQVMNSLAPVLKPYLASDTWCR
ncbi:MAG: glycosyl transferase family 51 [Rheinheimera sp.]|uniref:transglycosylase domain-containing protein n=1 Tax=Arsukibacterium sp. UBA3155 TaxID=1946058 RepID=UPI000C905C64|nr:transglycosylase domain-containing protein [Arsukibacterium sp. UBA3155]MAD74099.1 glycosyl transferase family 51 [Rheinheimera sp.]|tara:strand:+ start:530 stop:3598 length:3069 start_codon:yes stop_codon:yes gene_type:complete